MGGGGEDDYSTFRGAKLFRTKGLCDVLFILMSIVCRRWSYSMSNAVVQPSVCNYRYYH